MVKKMLNNKPTEKVILGLSKLIESLKESQKQ